MTLEPMQRHKSTRNSEARISRGELEKRGEKVKGGIKSTRQKGNMTRRRREMKQNGKIELRALQRQQRK